MTRFCPGCSKSKPESAFYRQSRRRSAMLICKDCHKARASARRVKRRAETSEEVRTEMSEKEYIEAVETASGRRRATIKEACRYGKFPHTML
ncbi:hypothetical protein GA0061099_10308 [Bradyrhizobium yuanmingense]|uniref:Uncharacterized protein n=1 Tax=Bradyrhizobium yuanmingense TaxID=108015 RepID=A0A1C3XJ11_9BRAD|nr:hypothetical protein IQ15_07349 [Bradyrhizobium yuanmingense]SCB52253.1 hypothetical protein GA0061099_10308 [Bradyrhizobium yuanmingense]